MDNLVDLTIAIWFFVIAYHHMTSLSVDYCHMVFCHHYHHMTSCHSCCPFHSLVYNHCILSSFIPLIYGSDCEFTPVIKDDGDMTANVPATNTIAKKMALVVFFNIVCSQCLDIFNIIISEI